MRSFFVAASLALVVLAAVPSAFAQTATDRIARLNAAEAQISADLAANPNGNPANAAPGTTDLSSEISAIIEQNPDIAAALANYVVQLAANANPQQQQALGIALADAANFYARNGNQDLVNQIVAAIATGPAVMVAAADAEISPTAGGGGTGTSGSLRTNFTSGSAQNSCVSPSRPGPC